jgi:hypothetical protein
MKEEPRNLQGALLRQITRSMTRQDSGEGGMSSQELRESVFGEIKEKEESSQENDFSLE